MSYNYLVTAQKPTSATHSVTGHFTSSRDLNLIVAKGNRLEIHTVTPEGLVAVLDVGLYGTISCLQLFRPQNEQQDSLFVLTAKYHVAILSYDQASGDVITRAYGDVKSRVGKPTEIQMIGLVDPDCKVIGIHIYSGLLKIVPLELDSGQELRAIDIRLDDLFVVDLTFLHGYKTPTIAYIAEMKDTRQLKVFSLAVNEVELKQCSWHYNVEPYSNIIIPTPLSCGGCVIVGLETITYYNKDYHKSIPLAKDLVIQCYGRVDGHRYLVGDTTGKLFMLYLHCEEKMSELPVEVVTDLKLQLLGEAAIGKSLSYLDNGVVFVASSFGDSQLVKLSTEPTDASGSFVQLLDSYTGLGPILDMAAVDLTRQGYDQLITCSGAGKEGSLRVIRNGIGINELASIDLSNIKGVWAVKTGSDDDGMTFNNTLVLSFVGQTRILLLNDEEVEEAELGGFSDDEQTFFAGNVAHGQLIQVTMTTIRMIDADGLNLICEWKPPSGRNISTVACNREQIVVAIGRDVHYIEIGDGAFKDVSHVTMEYEVACIDITPLTVDKQHAELCALGLWTDISVHLLKLPTLDIIHCQLLGGEIIPRSIAMVQFEGISYLLVALGDGTLFYFNIDPSLGNITNQKRLVLGTKPVILRHFKVAGSKNIFACSDQPTIIYSSNHKLLFSNVNMKEVTYMCSLNSKTYQDSLALINANCLTIGTVDEIQKLHIRTIPLFESPRRIAFHSTTRTFGVVTVRHDVPVTVDGVSQYAPARSSASTTAPSRSFSSGDVTTGNHRPMVVTSSGTAVEVHSVLLVDSINFEVLHAHQLKPMECSLAIASCELGGEEYIIVGTGVANHENYESTSGRLVVMSCSNGKLEVFSETEVPGCVYCIVSFNGRLVAAINNRVSVYRWSEDKLLKEVATYTNNIMALFLKVKGDFILVGDLLRSFSLLVFKQDKKEELSLIAMDTNLNPAMMMAIEIIDDDTFLGADSQHIFICQKNSDATTEEDMRYMIQPAQVHVGDSVNVFRHGSLVMEHPGLNATPILGKPIIFGTIFGSIGMVCQLKDDAYRLLGSLQQSLLTVVNSVGNIEHSVWRAFSTEHRTRVSVGFIDGDLVERFLDLPHDKMELVVKNMKPTQPGASQDVQNNNLLDEIIKLVEDLSRLH